MALAIMCAITNIDPPMKVSTKERTFVCTNLHAISQYIASQKVDEIEKDHMMRFLLHIRDDVPKDIIIAQAGKDDFLRRFDEL